MSQMKFYTERIKNKRFFDKLGINLKYDKTSEDKVKIKANKPWNQPVIYPNKNIEIFSH